MSRLQITVGLVPSRRMEHTEGCERLRVGNIAMLEGQDGVRLVSPPTEASSPAPVPRLTSW